MLSRRRRLRLELYRHETAVCSEFVKPLDSGVDGGDPSGSQCQVSRAPRPTPCPATSRQFV